jgi:hypothetical protein
MVKRGKYITLILILAMNFLEGVSQKFTLGGVLRYPIYSELLTVEEKIYYFSDDVNSIYSVQPEDKLKPRSLMFPEVYARIMFNDNIFARYKMGYLSFLKSVNINYNSRFHDNLNYTNNFDYSFLTNQLSAGYRFLRGKEIRFELSAGVSHYYLLRFKEVSRKDKSLLLVNQYPFGQVIHQDISSIKRSFFSYDFSAGLEYYILILNVSYQRSFTELNVEGDFYQAYNAFFVSAGINLFNFLIENKKFVKYKTEE